MNFGVFDKIGPPMTQGRIRGLCTRYFFALELEIGIKPNESA
jgi:hypothetical protein